MKTNKKYDTKAIMKRAWEIRREQGLTMGESMKAAWAEAKAAAGVTAMDSNAHDLFHAMAELDRWKAIVEQLQGEFKAACAESPDGKISGYGWTASLTTYERTTLDTTKFKKEHADVYAAYSRKQSVTRFNFGAVAVST